MSNGSERRIPVMPQDIAERSAQAWTVAHRAEAKAESSADRATEAYFDLIGEVRQLRSEGNARETRWEAWRESMARQINALTHATRQVRRATSSSSDEEIRNELPTLPEIIVEQVRAELRRDSDRTKADWVRRVQGWAVKGVGKAVTLLVTAALLAAMGWLARDLVQVRPHAAPPTTSR